MRYEYPNGVSSQQMNCEPQEIETWKKKELETWGHKKIKQEDERKLNTGDGGGEDLTEGSLKKERGGER